MFSCSFHIKFPLIFQTDPVSAGSPWALSFSSRYSQSQSDPLPPHFVKISFVVGLCKHSCSSPELVFIKALWNFLPPWPKHKIHKENQECSSSPSITTGWGFSCHDFRALWPFLSSVSSGQTLQLKSNPREWSWLGLDTAQKTQVQLLCPDHSYPSHHTEMQFSRWFFQTKRANIQECHPGTSILSSVFPRAHQSVYSKVTKGLVQQLEQAQSTVHSSWRFPQTLETKYGSPQITPQAPPTLDFQGHTQWRSRSSWKAS